MAGISGGGSGVWCVVLLAIVCRTAAGRSQLAGQPRGGSWIRDRVGTSNFTYRDLFLMMRKTEHVLRTLALHIESVRSQAAATAEERLRVEVLLVYQRELKATSHSLAIVLRDLNQTLTSDYSSLERIKRSCQQRLEDMRAASVFVEDDYNTILELEHMDALHPNASLQSPYGVLNEILAEISHAADDLESELQPDFFRSSKNMEGAVFETVVKLWDSSHREDKGGTRRGVPVLIDSASNRYVLTRPRDVTVPTEDHHLVHDIVCLLLLSFLLGAVCSLLKIPTLLGYMCAGTLLGPVGCNVISSIVQVESIGELGVFLIVFVIGLEFSPEKLGKVWHISVYGSNLLLLVNLLLAVFLGLPLGVSPRQAIFVAACLSLSSTPLAMKLTSVPGQGHRRGRSPSSDVSRTSEVLDSDMARRLMGILVMQDVQMGLLMAVMTLFSPGPTHQWKGALLVEFVQSVLGFCLLVVAAHLMATKLLDRFYRMLAPEHGHNESVLVGSVAVCFLLLLLADLVGTSTELGCFLAGVAVSSQTNTTIVDHVRYLLEPVKDLFAVFFFASVGFHVFPTFLASEFTMIFFLTLCIVALKFVLGVCVLGAFLGHCRSATWVLVFALTPVSEFSFVLASRCRRLGIISREVYLVVLSVAALSLLLGPLLWRLILMVVNVRRGLAGHWRELLLSRSTSPKQ